MAAKKPNQHTDSSKITENSAAISRINQLIEEENSKIQKIYLEIGKNYVQLHKEDYEEAFVPLMQEFSASQDKLHDYSLQMQVATGIIICPSCGHKAPKGSVFCNMCGSKLPVINFDAYEICKKCGSLIKKGLPECPHCHTLLQPDDNFVQCPKCKESVGKDNLFCPICGESLQKKPIDPSKKKCPNPHCGAVMSSDKLFCTECGTKLIQ